MTDTERTPPGARGHNPANRGAIVEFIRRFHAQHGYPPSVRQIGVAVGLRSTATVQDHLDRLVRAGILTREGGGQVRTLRLVEPVDTSLSDARDRVVSTRRNLQAALEGKLPVRATIEGALVLLDKAAADLGPDDAVG